MNKWLAKIEGMLTSATEGMTEEQLTWHPEGKWSTAQVLEHLAKTYAGTSRGFEKAISAQRSLATRATPWQHFARTTVVGFGYFPPGRKSPEVVVPNSNWTGEHAIKTIREELAKLYEAQEKVEKTFSGIPVVDHPVMGPLTPAQWAKFHYVHAKHHAKQIATLRRQMATTGAARA
jgi:hypothetical protein